MMAVIPTYAETTVTVDGINYSIDVGKASAKVVGTSLPYRLESVALPDSVVYSGAKYCVTEIGTGAFMNQNRLESVRLPQGLTTIRSEAFKFCTSLSSIELPKTLQMMESEVFGSCRGLTSVRSHAPYIAITMYTFLDVNEACALYYPKVYELAYAEWREYFGECVPFTYGYTGYSFEPSTKEAVDCQQLQTIAVYFDGISGIAPSDKASTLTARLWMDGEVIAESVRTTEAAPGTGGDGEVSTETTADGEAVADENTGENAGSDADGENAGENAGQTPPEESADTGTEQIVFGENMLTVHFDGIPDDLFVSKEPDVFRQVRLTIEGNVLMDGCSFDLALGTSAEDSAQWDVRTAYVPEALPLDHRGVQVDPSGAAPLESYKMLQTVELAFQDFGDVALDADNGAMPRAILCRNGESLYELRPEDFTCEGNVLAMHFPIQETDVLVAVDSLVEDVQFSLLVDGNVLLDGVKYVLSFGEHTEPAGDEPQYASSVQWDVPVLRMPEPSSVAVAPQTVATCADLARVSIDLGGIADVMLDETSAEERVARILLGEVCVADGTVVIEDGELVCNFPEIDERFFSLISAVADTSLTATLQVSAPLLLRTAELEGYYPYTLRIMPDGNPVKWDVPATVYPLPAVTVSTPLAETPQTYLDLREIVIAVDGFSSLALVGPAEGYVMRGDSLNPVYRFDAGSIDVEGTQLLLHLPELPPAAVAVPVEYEGNTVTLALHLTAELLLDGMPYTLTIDGKEQNAEWPVEAVVIRDMPAPVLSYSYGHLTMVTGVEGATYHYTIVADDHQTSGCVAMEKNGKEGFGETKIRQTFTIQVYATCEGYNDSDTVTYTLDFNGEYPEVISGETTDGVLNLLPSCRKKR